MGKQFDPGVLRRAVQEVISQVSVLDAGLLGSDDAVSLLSLFARGEAAMSSGKALCARRVELSNAHVGTGHRDAAGLVAARTGVSVADARGVLETARQLESLPGADGAFRSGELSRAQVAEVAKAASVDPSVEKDMLELAKRDSLRALRDESKRVRVAGCSEADEYEAAYKKRYLRVKQIDKYSVELHGRFTTVGWAPAGVHLEYLRDRVFREARRVGKRESPDAYMADAFIELVTSDKTPGTKTEVNVVVDHSALVRGELKSGERCEIPGVGPIPVSMAEQMAQDCFLRVLVTKGRDVLAMGTESRYIPAAVKAALNLKKKVCSIRGCDAVLGLQLDHRQERRDRGKSKLQNLAWLCPFHHQLKTTRRYQLRGPTGDYELVPASAEVEPPALFDTG